MVVPTGRPVNSAIGCLQPPQQRINPVVVDDDSDVEDNPFAAAPLATLQADCWWESGFKVNILKFYGSLQVDDFLDWLHIVEEILEFKKVADNHRVPLVIVRLRERLQAWWHRKKNSHARFD